MGRRGRRRAGSSSSNGKKKQQQQHKRPAAHPPPPPPVIINPVKRESILHALNNNQLDTLRELAIEDGGLVSNDLRAAAWRVLLRMGEKQQQQEDEEEDIPLPASVARQIDLDVARSYSGEEDDGKRSTLRRFLVRYFTLHHTTTPPPLHYYQGFHDVAAAVLDVFPFEQENEKDALEALHRLSCFTVFRDAHDADFAKVQRLLLAAQDLVGMASTAEYAAVCNEFPFWGVSMLVAGFAHDIKQRDHALRVFDALVAKPAYFALYLVAALPLLPQCRAAVLAPDANPHEAIRSCARRMQLEDADELVRVAQQLERETAPHKLLLHAEVAHGVSRESSVVFDAPNWLHSEWTAPPKPKPLPPPAGLATARSRRRMALLVVSLAVVALAYWWGQGERRRWIHL